ncbi:MAG: hydroxyethylthiazole kinase [Chloroflexi bacterium]|nr:hydroxyethylthiazole kinase [Chloroflexota bacterium]MBI3733447.1 hydroxyethylthiazole kinase [Chloroflexota bacterium]
MDRLTDAAEILERVRAERPLIHHITNFVTMNDVANATLAIGATPVMAHAVEEVSEVTASARALALNLGTPSPARIEAMCASGQTANQHHIPIVFDPVGVGATQFRAESARRLLDAARVQMIRGNASEVAALVNSHITMRGVDANGAPRDVTASVQALAALHHSVVAATGARDFVSDGQRVIGIDNGHPWFARITGAGCMATAIVAAFAAVETDRLRATVAALTCYGIAGEIAAAHAAGIGSFKLRLMDALFALTPEQIYSMAKIVVVDEARKTNKTFSSFVTQKEDR